MALATDSTSLPARGGGAAGPGGPVSVVDPGPGAGEDAGARDAHGPSRAGVRPAATSGAGAAPAGVLDALADLVADGDVLVLSGAGISTESGIPDYRGPTGRARRAEPMTYQAFLGSAAARQRYWARSHSGWRHITGARPNEGHRAVADMQRRGLLTGIITQNVDGLHQAGGACDVTELHGSLYRVVCLSCGQRTRREALDRRLAKANTGWDVRAGAINPDGDAVLTGADVAAFRVAGCLACGGLLKPDVVFFGENVPPQRVRACYELVEAAGALLVLGSSLTVMSGYRFARHAARRRIPVVIVNDGPTRGDDLACLKIEGPLGVTLTGLLARVGPL